MPKTEEDDKNSVCSLEEVEVKDKEIKEEEEEDENEEEEEEDDEEEEEDEDEEDDDEEYDPTIINFELLKNFFVDEEGTNVATHLGSISKELRTLNKILLKKNKD
jgi:ABC-type Zn2+ transport system substrate-binding protein/surface adhesin